MHLVQNHHLARQAEQPDGAIPGRDRAKQRLVHRADAVARQQGLPRGGEPGAGLGDVVVGGFLAVGPGMGRAQVNAQSGLQPGVGVGQWVVGFLGQGVAQKPLHPGVNAVAGQLGGQREVEPGMMPRRDQAMRDRQGCLRLAAAHRRFDHVKARRADGLQAERLQRIRLESSPADPGVAEEIGKGAVRAKRAPSPTEFLERLPRPRPGALRGVVPLQREEAFVRSDPIGDGHPAGDEQELFVRGWREIRRWAEAADELAEERLAPGLHPCRLGLMPSSGSGWAGALPEKTPMVSAHGDCPAPGRAGGQGVVKEMLAHRRVIGLGELPPRIGRPAGQSVGCDPGRALQLKTHRDLPDVMAGCQHQRFGRQERLDGGGQEFPKRFRHAAHVEAMVVHGDAGLAFGRRFGPETYFPLPRRVPGRK